VLEAAMRCQETLLLFAGLNQGEATTEKLQDERHRRFATFY
jgi:hypothetical protein